MSDEKSRSPRYPSVYLGEALNRTAALYEKENKHQVAPDIAAQGLGYKSAVGGSAKQMIASLIYYGLIKRAADGKISVTTDFEKYKFAPDENIKTKFLETWFKNPKIFAELFEKYSDNLPSEGALKYELIERGFKPDTAQEAGTVFRTSLNFVKVNGGFKDDQGDVKEADDGIDDNSQPPGGSSEPDTGVKKDSTQKPANPDPVIPGMKPIPIFLPKGREAILYVPRPFYEKDRDIISKYLGILPTDDEDSE